MLPFVSIIVVNYNGRTLLGECLQSLQAQDYPRPRYEVILVDNASSDQSLAFVRREFPRVRTLSLPKNLGFTGGNNAGFAVARGEWLALLNSDASAEPHWLSESVRAGNLSPDTGGVAGHLVFRNQPNIVNSTGLELYSDGRAGDRDLRRNGYEIDRPAGEVFGGCGAGLLLRRAMIQQLGGFDADLFMYYEDLELSWRARQKGWRFVYAPAARVHHAFGCSIGVSSPMQARYVERNRTIVSLKHAPLWLATATGLGMIARIARAAFRSIRRSKVGTQHVFGLARAAAEVAMRLPWLVAERLAHPTGDAIYRQWSQPRPR